MDIEVEKSEVLKWIQKLKDGELIHKIFLLKKNAESKKIGERKFGSGKHVFTFVADDFDEPLDDFKEYM